jgi:hypothetical protein
MMIFSGTPRTSAVVRTRLAEDRFARAKWLSGSRHSNHVRIQVAIDPVSFL